MVGFGMTGGLMASGLQAQLRQSDARPASKWTLAQFTRYMKDHGLERTGQSQPQLSQGATAAMTRSGRPGQQGQLGQQGQHGQQGGQLQFGKPHAAHGKQSDGSPPPTINLDMNGAAQNGRVALDDLGQAQQQFFALTGQQLPDEPPPEYRSAAQSQPRQSVPQQQPAVPQSFGLRV
ncbi:MAG: hypothetical protein KC474_02715 [Cyanobacteria bacterium HKST-UBA04]|nr:hypothetical protein [Cyanobacteria bacterium HKST-UBA04]